MDDRQELVFQLVNNEYLQPFFKDDIELSSFSVISSSDIAKLGAAFVPLTQMMSSSGSKSSDIIKKFGNTLYAATDKAGNPIELTTKVHGENNRFIGSRIENGKTAQTRFSPVSVEDLDGKPSVAFDPMTALIAAEMMYIAHEVDVIKQQQEDMFRYLLVEKRAELEGSLSFLIKVMNDYKDNYQNKVYKTSMHIKVLDIKQQAEQTLNASKKHIESFFKKKKDDFGRLSSFYQNYQIALYLYAFSSFTEVVVLENFASDYLAKISERIEDFATDYLTVYTDGYNYLKARSESAPQSVIMEIGAKAGKKIGEGIAKTPVGDKTSIDEKVISGSEKLEAFRELSVEKHLEEFCNYRETRIQNFIQLFAALDTVFNGNAVLFDSANMYIPKLD